MRELSVLPGLALILLSARLGGELCARLGLPSVFGELPAGFLLGPPAWAGFIPGRSSGQRPSSACCSSCS